MGLEADRLLDWNGRKTGDSLGRVMEDVYQRLMRDREGIVMDDSSKSVRSEGENELRDLSTVECSSQSLRLAAFTRRRCQGSL